MMIAHGEVKFTTHDVCSSIHEAEKSVCCLVVCPSVPACALLALHAYVYAANSFEQDQFSKPRAGILNADLATFHSIPQAITNRFPNLKC